MPAAAVNVLMCLHEMHELENATSPKKAPDPARRFL